jgi:uncharacterized membrane protein
MKSLRKCIVVLAACVTLAVPGAPVLAATATPGSSGSGSSKSSGTDVFSGVCGTSGTSDSAVCQDSNPAHGTGNPLLGPNGTIRKATTILSVIAGVVAVIIIVICGLRMVVSGGDAARVKQAREGIIYALIGLVVIILAQPIIGFVLNKVYSS